MKSATQIATVSAIALLATTPANAAWIKDTVSGVLDSGTDFDGLLGTPGANLTGLSYSFSIYYRDTDIVVLEGYNGDADLRSFRASGFVGDLKIPFSVQRGGWGTLEDDSAGWFVDGDAAKRYPGLHAYFDPPWSVQQYNSARLTYAGSIIGQDYSPIRSFVYLGAGPIPEASIWAMMLSGFGAIGAVMRRSRRQRVAVSYT